MVKLDVDARRFVGRFTKRLGSKAAFTSKPVCIQRKKEKDKKQWNEDLKRISVARDVHESWKNIECMCVYSSDTALAQHLLSLELQRRARFPSVCSASTSLTYPSSFCQAGIRTTAGDPWLCKLQRNKHELLVNTPSPNTHRLLVLQISVLHSEQIQYFF